MKKILIISSNRLGDSILTSGLINHYKKINKMNSLTFVCGDLPAKIFKHSRNIERLISLKKKKNSSHWFFLWFKVFLNFWDEIVDLRGSAISYFLFTKKRIISPYIDKDKKQKIHKVLSISKFYNKKLLAPKLDIQLKKIFRFENHFLSNYYKSFVAIAPGANWVPKQWPKENFVSLIKKLITDKKFNYCRFILIGSKNEKFIGDFICKSFNKGRIINLIGKPKLIEVCSILKKCKLFIGNDSGLMHLAAALKIPTVGLFGPSDIKQYSPWGNNTLSIKTPESPSELMDNEFFSPKNKVSLMKSLKVAKVEKEILNFHNKLNVTKK